MCKRTLMRVANHIDVRDFSFFREILIRVPYKIMYGNRVLVRDLSDVPSFIVFNEISMRILYT